jgi:uncharacterized protein YkwD
MNAAAAIGLALAAGASIAATDAALNDDVAQLGKLINDYRTQRGLHALTFDVPLSRLAREHATRMGREHRLSHEDFQQRFARAGSPTCVENVAATPGTAKDEFEAWRDSPTHAHNLLDARITRMGLAIDGRYAVFFACR